MTKYFRSVLSFNSAILLMTLFISLSLMANSTLRAEKDKNSDDSDWASTITDGINANLSEDQRDILNRVNNYFNKVTDLRGRFTQINPDDGQQRGKFYIKRPGRIRFDYAPPSLQRIISDGNYLSIENHDIGTVDRFPLNRTPFRILLAAYVSIDRDAIIQAVTENDEEIAISMLDSKGEALGRIQLFFNKDPEIELREWKVTDAQGLETRIILSHLNYDKKIDGKLFTLKEHVLPHLRR